MSNEAARLQIAECGGPQLRRLNEKIARLAVLPPWDEIQRSFFIAAQLAGDAVRAAEDLQQMPGTDPLSIRPILEFLASERKTTITRPPWRSLAITQPWPAHS